MATSKLISRLSRLILQNEKGMVKERDLRNICPNPDDFSKLIPEIVKSFKNLGFSLIRTTFNNEKYYVVTTPGKDKNITPSMYGALGLIIATYNEIGSDIEILEMKKLFREIWKEIESLIQENYLHKISDNNIEKIGITPLGKAAFKNMLKTLDLKKIIEF